MEIELRELDKPGRCAFCHAPIGVAPVVCDRCGTRLHAECLAALRVCPTLGCGTRLPQGKPRRTFLPVAIAFAGVSLLLALGLRGAQHVLDERVRASAPVTPPNPPESPRRGSCPAGYPDDSEGHFGRAREESSRDPAAAIRDYTLHLEHVPGDPSALSNRGLLKLDAGDLDGALADLDKSLEIVSDHVHPLLHRARLKTIRQDFDGAIADYTKAIELDPTDGAACRNRALARDHKGDFDGAMADYTKAIELDPKEPRSYHYRGCLLYDRRKWTDALADFRKADEVATSYREYPQLRIWLVRARLGERHAATKELAEYLAAMKSHDDWYSKMARLLTDQLSEDDFFKAAESPDPKTDRGQKCEAYFYAAIRRLIDGDREKAREYLEKCLQTDAKTYFEYSSARSELQALDRGE